MIRPTGIGRYQILGLVVSLITLASMFLPWVGQASLTLWMQDKPGRAQEFFGTLSFNNFIGLVAVAAFLLFVLGSIAAIFLHVYKYLPSRAWNAAMLVISGLILFSAPTFSFTGEKLEKITATLSIEYWPSFGGFGVGYYACWLSSLLVLGLAVVATRKYRVIFLRKPR